MILESQKGRIIFIIIAIISAYTKSGTFMIVLWLFNYKFIVVVCDDLQDCSIAIFIKKLRHRTRLFIFLTIKAALPKLS